jgi:PAS domain S-box-containing protein
MTSAPRKVLDVEDVPSDAEMMLYELRQAGLCGETRRVWDRIGFVEALYEFRPEVILSDFSLPSFDGIAALGLRQQLCPETPFIIVSGSLGEERAVQILKAGATDYVLKNDLARLATAVERALADGEVLRDRTHMAHELENERQLLAAVLNSSAALIVLLDQAGRLVRINPAAATACGITESRALGQPYAELFVDPPHIEQAHAMFGQIIGRQQAAAATWPPWRELNRLGRMILWSVSFLSEPGSHGETIVLAGIDITDQQQQEQTQARLVAIVDSSDDAIMSKTLDGVITSWNRGAERIFGHTPQEAVGQSMLMLTSAQQHEEELQVLDRIRAGESITHFQTTRRRKDGQEISVSMTVSPLRDASGQIIGISQIARDISQQKRLEELRLRGVELEAENRRVHEANRTKSEFLANMSHELRTPLNAIIGFADLLYDEQVPAGSPTHKEFLGHIRTSGQHLLQLINDILDLSKVEAGKLEFFPEPFSLERAVTEVSSILRSIAMGKGIQVGVDLDPALGILVLDPARLKQVLYNYLSNALKFTSPGGQVTIRGRAEGADRFRLEVEDTGIGIAAEDAKRLFVDFEQLDGGKSKSHSGTGLGLALTKRLVEGQGGSVGVRSVPGQGSVFHAVLPRSRPGSAVHPALRSSPPVATSTPARAEDVALRQG